MKGIESNKGEESVMLSSPRIAKRPAPPGPNLWQTVRYGIQMVRGRDVNEIFGEMHRKFGRISKIGRYVLIVGRDECRNVLTASIDEIQRSPLAEKGVETLGGLDGKNIPTIA